VYVLSVDGKLQNNLLWVDTMTAKPLGGFDWLVPYMRPPDVPNVRGIGLPDPPLVSSGVRVNRLDPMSPPHPVWPPTDELGISIPAAPGTGTGGIPERLGYSADGQTVLDLSVQLSPLCFPMHDHSEISQTAQGGNYNLGLISGMNFTGDRNTPGGVTTFPNAPKLHGPSETSPAAGPEDGDM
jgi:hypothetical protein